jgi:LPS O-antigen subunit length determinant protein (WzzB/FepE family)
LIESQVKQRMLAVVTPEFAFRVIDHAVAPDKDDVHFPNKLIMYILGLFIGVVFGVLLVLGRASWDAPRRDGR